MTEVTRSNKKKNEKGKNYQQTPEIRTPEEIERRGS